MYTKLLPLVLCVFVSGTFGCRGSKSSEPPVHLNPNMDNQDKYKPYRASTFFKNKRAMQTPPEGTVPVGKLGADSPDWKVRVSGRKVKSAKQFHTGQVNGVYQNEVNDNFKWVRLIHAQCNMQFLVDYLYNLAVKS